MNNAEISIRRMDRSDLDRAVEWAAQEGWNPGLHDADCFYAADPNGFFVAELNGEAVGYVSAVVYDDTFGFLGFYIVRQELRHHGIGMALCRAAFDYLGNRTAGADGVVAMLEKYQQSGLKIEHYNARYEGTGAPSATQCRGLQEIPFAELERYDRRFFPAQRPAFLKSWISRPGTSCKAITKGDRLAGYGVIRPCRSGYKIGPLFANTPAQAEELFCSLSALAAGQPVYLDIPVCNASALALVERHGMRKVFETARIYKGTPPVLPLDDIYGITSFELG